MTPLGTPSGAAATSRGWRMVGRIKGWMMVGTIVLLSVASHFVAAMLSGVLRDNRIKPSAFGQLFLDAPWIVAVLSLPALASCVPLVRGTERAFRWMTISTVLVLIPLAFFLYGAVLCVSAIYSSALGG